MPRDVLLHDFGTDAFDLTVRQGLRAQRSARDAVNSVDSPTVILKANHTSGVGPAGFIFGATALGFATARPYHELRYKWTFGDPGTFPRLAPNMPWGTDHNVAYGPWAAHTFAPTPADFLSAGSDTITYTVTCEVTDGTSTITETMDVTVSDPNVVFAGNGTLIVDPSGNYSLGLSLYPGAQTFTSVVDAEAVIGNGDFARVILRGNASYASPNIWRCEHLQITSFGQTGEAYPIFDRGGIEIDPNHAGDVEIYGVDLFGGYDPTLPNSRDGVIDGIEVRGKHKTDHHTTIHDVGIRGHNKSITFEGQRMNNVISGCTATDWYDFGVFQGNAGWLALVGTSLQQNPATVNGDGKYNSDYANHGPIRLSRVIDGSPIVMNNCDLASFNDWSVSASKYSVQPCLRLNNGGDPNLPELCVTQIRACGAQLGLPATNSYSASFPVRAVIDKVYHIKWGQGGRHLGASFGGVRFSNVVTVEADTDWAGGGLFNSGPGGYDATAGDYATRYPIYMGYPDTDGKIKHFQEYLGITVVKLASSDNVTVADNPIDVLENASNTLYPSDGPQTRNLDSITVGGLLIYAPTWNLNPDVRTDDPLTDYAVLPIGTNSAGAGIGTAYAMSLSDLASYAPRTAIPAQTGDVLPLDDFYGNLRSAAAPTAGAIAFL